MLKVNNLSGFGTEDGAVDPFFSDVTLLLQYNGTDPRTGVPSIAKEGFEFNVAGSVTLVADAESRIPGNKYFFANNQQYMFRSGAIDYSPYLFDSSDFTFECFSKLADLSTLRVLACCTNVATTDGWYMYVQPSGAVGCGLGPATGGQSGAGVVTTMTWYHFALVKDSTSVRLYVDGVMVFEISSYSLGNLANVNGVSLYSYLGFQAAFGYHDSVRITKACRYTGTDTVNPNFVVPTGDFPTR